MKRNIYILTATFIIIFFAGSAKVTAQTPFIKVVQPDASGISWSTGTKHLISWTDNLTGRVNIYLINYKTTPYDTTVIASNRRGSTYAWRISSGQVSGKHYKVLITSKTSPSIFDKGDHYFSLVKGTAGGTIHVEQPSAGNLNWSVGTKHLISWTDNLSERVNIRLINYETTPYDTTIIASNRSGSTYTWRISSAQVPGSHYKVLVVNSTNTAVYDKSDRYFTIEKGTVGGRVRIEQPNAGGIIWPTGTKHLISWSDNLSERVNIRLINYETTPYDTTVIASNRRGSTYAWRISSAQVAGRHFKVLVASTKKATVYDKSDRYFTLIKGTAGGRIHVEQPNTNGISWSTGTKHLISWTDNLSERVNIRLINYETTPYDTTVIASNRRRSTYVWRISSTQVTGRHFKVLVSSTTNAGIYDKSDRYFTLVKGTSHGKVHVERPNINGIVWSIRSRRLISWTDNLSERVNIKLINYETTPYDTTAIASNRRGSTYSWRIPSAQVTGRHFKVMVVSSVNPSVYDKSDHYFTLIQGTSGGTIHVEQPNNAGISWSVGTKKEISWTDNLTERVNVRLINYETSPYDTTTIASNVKESTYTWHIPSSQVTGSHFKVMVVSTVSASVYDKSDHYFSLIKGTPGGTVHIIQPSDAGISITAGTKYLISWMDNLSEKVNIRLINYGVSPYDTAVIASNVGGSTYSWHVSSSQTTGSHFKVMVVSTITPSVYDKSDHYFSIVAPTPAIDVYPNPSTTHVTVKFRDKDNENYTLILYNRYNMRVMSRQVNTTYMKEVRINTFDLPNGIYFLRLTSGKQVISGKIIVQH